MSLPSICQALRLVHALTTPGSRMMSFQVNMTSSAVNGWPSDHLMPLTSGMVSDLPSLDHSQLITRLGTGSSLSPRIQIGPVISSGSCTIASMPNQPWLTPAAQFQPSVGAAQTSRRTPPYSPGPSEKNLLGMTCGVSGRRCSIGGSVPALTAAAIYSGSEYLSSFL